MKEENKEQIKKIISDYNTVLKVMDKVDEPIHKFFKPLQEDQLLLALDLIKKDLKQYLQKGS